MEPEPRESLFINTSKSLCNFKDTKTKTTKGGKCHRPGPLMRNPYLNFLREFRKRNCGLTVIEVVQKGAKEWNAMPKDKKLRYIEEAFYAPKLRRGCCATQLAACLGKKKRKVSISAKTRRSRSTSCSSRRRSSRRRVSKRRSSSCSIKRSRSRRRISKRKSTTCAPKRKGRKRSRKSKKSKCGQQKKLRKRRPKFGKSSCKHKTKKVKRLKKKRSVCDLC